MIKGKIMGLSPEEKRELLGIVRQTLESYLRDRSFPEIDPRSPRLREGAGAFVTLERRGELRGCIGHMAADKPLYLTVQEMAVQAATGDPRFPPVTSEELPEVEIEISALSPLRTIADPSEIRIGEHGVVISRGVNRGVLLPQVAAREGWDREKFLGYTCLKAGLPFDSWKSVEVKIEIFGAEVFGEKDLSS
jgi:AmmeMemoRadiSam system protein A